METTELWQRARAALDGLPGGRGLNIAHEAVDRHVLAGRGDHVAIRWLPKTGPSRDLSYADLHRATNRFASGLQALTGRSGLRVATLLGRIPELTVTRSASGRATDDTSRLTSVMASVTPAEGQRPGSARTSG